MRTKFLRSILFFALIVGAMMVTTAWAVPFTFQKGDIVVGVGQGQYKVFDPTGVLLTT